MVNFKNKSKQILAVAVFAALLVILLFYSRKFWGTEPEGGIAVGYTVDLSGPAASMGEQSKNGALLALEDLKKEGKQLKVTFVDDQSDAQKTITAYHKFVDVDKVRYLVVFGSGNAGAVAPLAQENQVVEVAISSDSKILDYKFTVKEGSDPSAYAVAAAEEITKRDYQRIYIIASNVSVLAEWLDQLNSQEGISSRIIGEKRVDPSDTDFRTVLVQAKAVAPDSLLLLTLPGKVGLLAKQAREMGIETPFFSMGVFEDQSAINTSSGALEGQWFVSPEVTQDFIDKYQAKYGKIPGREASNGYDAIMLLSQAIEAVGDDPIKVNDYLHQLDSFASNTAMGEMTVENGNFSKAAVVKVVKGDTFVPLEQQ